MTVQVQPTIDKEQIYELINVDLNARRYFFHKADERWLDWLWRNGFLDAMKEESATPFTTITPELDYLFRMAEKQPADVVDIMLDTPISTDTRSQEVVYGFLRICGSLPADQLARMVDKIRAERWIQLIDSIFTQSAFEYEAMLKALADVNDIENFLILAEAVLAVRPREEMKKDPDFHESPFYLDYLSLTNIFGLLAAVGPDSAEDALRLATKIMAEVVALDKQDVGPEFQPEPEWDALIQEMRHRQVGVPVFEVIDRYTLLDVDFFDLELGQAGPHSFHGDVREMSAVAKTLLCRLVGERCTESSDVKRIYENHIASLPDSRVIWRLRLYALSLCPKVFRDDLRSALFRLFEVERYHEITSGAEYEKALQKGFPVLSGDEQQDFVQKTIQMFSQLSEDRKYDGSRILSMLLPFLDEKPQLKKQAVEAGLWLDPGHKPKPVLRTGGEFKEIRPRGTDTQDEFEKRPVAEIARKLRSEWNPAILHEQNSTDDRYSPLNAKGIGNQIKVDMPRRFSEYIENAEQFFERDVLDQHYTYTYLIGIQETILNHRKTAFEANWNGVVDLLIAIKNSGEKDPFERETRAPNWFETWLANWDAVHLVATDIVLELISEKEGLTLLDFSRYRDQILAILGYLLKYPDPSPADEDFEVPGSASDIKAMRDDPLNMAINSVRGRAFYVFNQFVFLDGEKIRSDVKQLYEDVIQRENTRAVLTMFGRHLSNFYFRDKNWTRKLLPLIFPQDTAKTWLYSAAWEGYLSAEPYGEMITDPEIQSLYQRALVLTDSDFPPGQKHTKEPNAGIAEHLALAFMYFKEFGLDHQLLQAFWKKENPKQHAHFVQSIGRFFISEDDSDEFFSNNPESKNRLRDFWDWLLQKQENQDVFKEFGLWINLDKGVFEPAWLARQVRETLKKTSGILEWRYGLLRSSPQLAEAAPEETLEIARLYLLVGGVRGNEQGTLWHWEHDDKWIEAFEILYKNPSTRRATDALVNRLIGENEKGKTFWPLKKILVENP